MIIFEENPLCFFSDCNLCQSLLLYVLTSVVAPDYLNPDTDPAFQVNRIRIWIRFQIQGFDDQKLKKKIQLIFFLFVIKN